MELYGQQLNRAGLLAHVGQLSQVAGVRLVALADGAGRGTRLLEFRSGAGLEFEVVVDRGFDIGRASIAGRPLAMIASTQPDSVSTKSPASRTTPPATRRAEYSLTGLGNLSSSLTALGRICERAAARLQDGNTPSRTRRLAPSR